MWILPGWYSENWWENSGDSPCTVHQIMEAAGNYLATRPLQLGTSTTPTIAGKVSDINDNDLFLSFFHHSMCYLQIRLNVIQVLSISLSLSDCN